jgi:hypothetical protein
LPGSECERHPSFDDHAAFDAAHTLKPAYATSKFNNASFDTYGISRIYRMTVPHTLDPHEVDKPFTVFRFSQNQTCTDLRN